MTYQEIITKLKNAKDTALNGIKKVLGIPAQEIPVNKVEETIPMPTNENYGLVQEPVPQVETPIITPEPIINQGISTAPELLSDFNHVPKSLIEEMIQIYGSHTHDWLGNPISKTDELRFYCLRDQYGARTGSINAGALLTVEACRDIEKLAHIDQNTYDELHFLLQIANDLKCPITKEFKVLLSHPKKRMEQALNPEQETTKIHSK